MLLFYYKVLGLGTVGYITEVLVGVENRYIKIWEAVSIFCGSQLALVKKMEAAWETVTHFEEYILYTAI